MLSQDSFYRGLTPEELADVACEPKLFYHIPSNAFNIVTARERRQLVSSDEFILCRSTCQLHLYSQIT